MFFEGRLVDSGQNLASERPFLDFGQKYGSKEVVWQSGQTRDEVAEVVFFPDILAPGGPS